MKRLLFSLLGMMLVMSSANAQVLKGDMNGDGQLNVSDITALVNNILTNKKEYEGAANADIEDTWYTTYWTPSSVYCCTFSRTPNSTTYWGRKYSSYDYYPALNAIFLYDQSGTVQMTLFVKEKTKSSMVLVDSSGFEVFFYRENIENHVESISLSADKYIIHAPNMALGIEGETCTITAKVLPDFADIQDVNWHIDQDVFEIVSMNGSSITVRALDVSFDTTTTITAISKDGSDIYGRLLIRVIIE